MDRAAQTTAIVRDGLPGEIILAFTILSALRGPAASLPARGRGLKCVMVVGAAVGVDSRSPHGERGLKLPALSVGNVGFHVAPPRERGLKCDGLRLQCFASGRSRAGARIEIPTHLSRASSAGQRPLCPAAKERSRT